VLREFKHLDRISELKFRLGLLGEQVLGDGLPDQALVELEQGMLDARIASVINTGLLLSEVVI